MKELLLNILVSLGTGALSGWIFYLLAGRDLKREAKELARLNSVILRAMRDNKAEIVYDKSGAPYLSFRLETDPAEFKLSPNSAGLIYRDSKGNVTER